MHDDRNTPLSASQRLVTWLFYIATLSLYAFLAGAAVAVGGLL